MKHKRHMILPIEIHCLAIVAQICIHIRMSCRIIVCKMVAVCNSHVPRRQFPVRPILAGMDEAYGAGACVAPIPSLEFAFTPRRPHIKWPRKSTVARHPGTEPCGGPRGRGDVIQMSHQLGCEPNQVQEPSMRSFWSLTCHGHLHAL